MYPPHEVRATDVEEGQAEPEEHCSGVKTRLYPVILTVHDCPALQTGEDGPTETSPATTPSILEDTVMVEMTLVEVAVDDTAVVVVVVDADVAVVV